MHTHKFWHVTLSQGWQCGSHIDTHIPHHRFPSQHGQPLTTTHALAAHVTNFQGWHAAPTYMHTGLLTHVTLIGVDMWLFHAHWLRNHFTDTFSEHVIIRGRPRASQRPARCTVNCAACNVHYRPLVEDARPTPWRGAECFRAGSWPGFMLVRPFRRAAGKLSVRSWCSAGEPSLTCQVGGRCLYVQSSAQPA